MYLVKTFIIFSIIAHVYHGKSILADWLLELINTIYSSKEEKQNIRCGTNGKRKRHNCQRSNSFIVL